MSASATYRRARAAAAAAAALALCALGVLAAGVREARAANLAPPIRAVFLKEFSRPEYTMVQGQLLILENNDPFLTHGIAGAISALNAEPGKDRLVRNSPYLGPGSYPFFDPLHPEMRATLTVTPGVSPPPDTTPPTSHARILGISSRKFAATGGIRLRLTLSEAADVDLTVKLGKKKVATSSAAFADPVTRVIALTVPQEHRSRIRSVREVVVKGIITDVSGQTSKINEDRNLGPKRKKGKARK